MWRASIARAPDRVLVAEHEGTVVGLAAFGPTLGGVDSSKDVSVGELYALNIDPNHWGKGAGRALLA